MPRLRAYTRGEQPARLRQPSMLAPEQEWGLKIEDKIV